MHILKTLVIATAAAGLGSMADAGNGKAKGPVKKVQASANCPPGLAKKNPPCVPPGLAKQRYGVGDRIVGDYVILRDPRRYGLNDGTYYRVGDYIYRVDRDTLKVLAFIGAAAALLN